MAVSFLPTSRIEMKRLNWAELDFLLISGDAYVDHPSFGHAIIGRFLEHLGYRVGILAQPNWKDDKDLLEMGIPALGVLITAGNLDSMLNHYSARKNRRQKDLYSHGGIPDQRPDRATIVYTNLARRVFKGKPIIIGGIEASLRRFVHYDYWDDTLRRSILLDSKADLLVYGMAEYTIELIAKALQKGISLTEIQHLPGICYLSRQIPEKSILLPSYEECLDSKKSFADSFRLAYLEQDPIRGRILCQPHGDRYLIQNPPAPPLKTSELDRIYNIPFQRTCHPRYQPEGVPALDEIKFSITSHRGCYGACSFCSLHFHQGRIIQARSHQSILNEVANFSADHDFKGYIHDVGGPTANFRQPACPQQLEQGTCVHRQCLYPNACANLKVDHSDYLTLLRKLRKLPQVKRVFIRSGIRYDYLMMEKETTFLEELCRYHISGQLKVAPEHSSERVTSLMGKPSIEVFNRFKKAYDDMNKKVGKKQYLIPYFMSGHPGATLNDAVHLAEYLRDLNFQPKQVQEFIPTPGTYSTCMFYTGIDPFSGKKVHVPKGEEKALQRALLQYRNPYNKKLVLRALQLTKRYDLIGNNKKCLVSSPSNRKAKNKIK